MGHFRGFSGISGFWGSWGSLGPGPRALPQKGSSGGPFQPEGGPNGVFWGGPQEGSWGGPGGVRGVPEPRVCNPCPDFGGFWGCWGPFNKCIFRSGFGVFFCAGKFGQGGCGAGSRGEFRGVARGRGSSGR